MAKGKEENSNGRSPFWAGYGRQVLIAPALAFALLAVFSYFFSFDASLLWTNAIVLAIWFVLVLFAFRSRAKGGVWRDYRWIIVPAVLILLFLFDTSWAQSALSTSSLKKNIVGETSLGSLQLHAEYPSQILYDDINESNIQLWVTGSSESAQQTTVEVSSTGQALLFAIKPQSDNVPVEWRGALTLELAEGTNAMTLLVQPISPPDVNSQLTNLILSVGSKNLDTSKWSQINVESKLASQIRTWKKNFLDAGSLVVSLITAVFVGVKQLEEERKRQRADQIKQIIETFDANAKNDLSKTLQEHLELTADWDEWDRVLKDQFRKKYSSFIERGLWDALAAKTLEEIKSDVEHCLQIYAKVFQSRGDEKLFFTLKRVQSALQQDGKALLSLVRNYPESIAIARRIAKNYPTEIKDKIIQDLRKDYEGEIKRLGRELGFPTDYPLLQSLFWRYSIPNQDEGKLREWLNLHKLTLSPFADADTPFTYLSGQSENFLIDLTSTGFSFDLPPQKQVSFKFNDPWDLRTVVYNFCKTLPATVASQAFLVLFPPSLLIDFEKEPAVNLVLHALGKQWFNTIVDEPTTLYDLNIHEQKVLARLLCWHYGSVHSVLARLFKEIDKRYALISNKNQLPNKDVSDKEKNAREFLKRASNWMESIVSTPVEPEEIPHLIDLRPSSTYSTFFLMPSIDLDFCSGISVHPEKYRGVDAIVDWLDIHHYTFVHFYLTDQDWRRINDEKVLIEVINQRVQQCVVQKDLSLDQKINSLNDLFVRHDKEEAQRILAQKAGGSPGRMVRLGQKLLLQHVEKYPPNQDLHIEDLLALE